MPQLNKDARKMRLEMAQNALCDAAEPYEQSDDNLSQAVDNLSDAITAYLSHAGGWRPIESAPTDEGRWLLLADETHVSVGSWDTVIPGGLMRWISVNGYFGSLIRPRRKPTHWMPLPPPPSDTGTGGEG